MNIVLDMDIQMPIGALRTIGAALAVGISFGVCADLPDLDGTN